MPQGTGPEEDFLSQFSIDISIIFGLHESNSETLIVQWRAAY